MPVVPLATHVDLQEDAVVQLVSRQRGHLDDVKGYEGYSVVYSPAGSKEVVMAYGNPFVNAVQTAYNRHINLRLRPDDLWLVIAQGVMEHVLSRGEELRSMFVGHKGKKKLEVQGVSWEDCIEGLFQGVRGDNRCAEFMRAMSPGGFTTTTAEDVFVGKMVVVSSMKKYYDFYVTLQCGIPGLLLEGTLDDWKAILERVDVLAGIKELGLGWWLQKVRKVCLEFLAAYEGKPDVDFWGRIITIEHVWGSSGESNIDGWITWLFPYVEGRCRKGRLDSKISSLSLPNGRATVPVTKTPDAVSPYEEKMDYVGGFLGCTVDVETKSIGPYVSWYVGKKACGGEEMMGLNDRFPNRPMVVAEGKETGGCAWFKRCFKG